MTTHLNKSEEHGCQGNSDRHGLEVKGGLVEDTERDKEESEGGIDGIEECCGDNQRIEHLHTLTNLVELWS